MGTTINLNSSDPRDFARWNAGLRDSLDKTNEQVTTPAPTPPKKAALKSSKVWTPPK